MPAPLNATTQSTAIKLVYTNVKFTFFLHIHTFLQITQFTLEKYTKDYHIAFTQVRTSNVFISVCDTLQRQ